MNTQGAEGRAHSKQIFFGATSTPIIGIYIRSIFNPTWLISVDIANVLAKIPMCGTT